MKHLIGDASRGIVVGIDPSLTNTAVAWMTKDDFTIWEKAAPAPPGGLPTPAARIARYERLAEQVVELIRLQGKPALVVIEGYGFSRGHRAHQTGEVGAILRAALVRNVDAPVLEATPGELKMLLTGKGTASKAAMISAAVLRSGRVFATDDAADAYAAARFAAITLGIIAPATKAEAALVAKWRSAQEAQLTREQTGRGKRSLESDAAVVADRAR